MYYIWIPRPESVGQYYKLTGHVNYSFDHNEESIYGIRLVNAQLISSGDLNETFTSMPVTLHQFQLQMKKYLSETNDSPSLWNCGIKWTANPWVSLYTGDMKFGYVSKLLDGCIAAHLYLSHRFDKVPEPSVSELVDWREGF